MRDVISISVGYSDGQSDLFREADEISNASENVDLELGVDGFAGAADQEQFNVIDTVADGLLGAIEDDGYETLSGGLAIGDGDKVLEAFVVVARILQVGQVGVDGINLLLGQGQAKDPTVVLLCGIQADRRISIAEGSKETETIGWVLSVAQGRGDTRGTGHSKGQGSTELPLSDTRKSVDVGGDNVGRSSVASADHVSSDTTTGSL